MCNTGRGVDIKERIEIINKFVIKMVRSGYKERERGEIVRAGLRGYYKKVRIEEEG